MFASRTSSDGRVAIGGAPTISAASPSVSEMSGEKVQLGQPGAEGGDGAERADHHLARLAPDLGAGDDAGFGAGDAGVAHVRLPFGHVRPVLVVTDEDVAVGECFPLGGVGGRGRVLLLELLVAPVVGRVGGEVGAAGGRGHPVDQHAMDGHRREGMTLVRQRAVLHQGLGGHEAAVGGAEEERVEEGVGAEHLAVAGGVGPVGVDDGGIEVEGRHGDQLDVGVGGIGEVRAVGTVGGAHQLQPGVDGEDVGAEPGPGGQERDPPRRRLQAEVEHALVDLHHLDAAVLARGAPVRIERDGVEGDEAAHDLFHLAGGAEQPHVGAPVRHDREIGQVGTADGAHDGHGLAARAPAADADRHAGAELADDVVDGGALVGHQVEVSASRFSTKAARCSSATPRTCSSYVKPCSKR